MCKILRPLVRPPCSGIFLLSSFAIILYLLVGFITSSIVIAFLCCDNGEDNEEDATEENTSDETKEEDEQKSNLLEDNSKEDNLENQGGGAISDGIVYEIDFLIADDKELIDITKVNYTVDKYINNFYSEEMKKYKQSLSYFS